MIREVESWGGGCAGGGQSRGGGGGASSSQGSGADSSEDDESEEGLGETEEEVAALLVHLGKTRTYFDGFSDGATTTAGQKHGPSVHTQDDALNVHSGDPKHQQHQQHAWATGGMYGHRT